ncbi:hypothetical protein K3495_g11770 [Podosphaera aphanis]|nr:hypothetical protein K3495_g11770 [Podosphaera aphanis]
MSVSKKLSTKPMRRRREKKTTIEHLRAEDGSGAVFFGPSEIQRYNELNQQKDQEKEQGSRRAKKNYVNKRTIRVAAAEARKKVAAEKKAALASAREGKKNSNLTQLNINTDI